MSHHVGEQTRQVSAGSSSNSCAQMVERILLIFTQQRNAFTKILIATHNIYLGQIFRLGCLSQLQGYFLLKFCGVNLLVIAECQCPAAV